MTPTTSFTGIGVSPTVQSVVGIGDTVRVTFSEVMLGDATLIALGSYTLTPGGGGDVARAVVSVTPVPLVDPTAVDVKFDGELTAGTNNYTMDVDANLKDKAGNPITGSLSILFNGGGVFPIILSVTPSADLLKIRVTYSEPVKQVSAANPDDALNPSNYSLAGPFPVVVNSVVGLVPNAVALAVIGLKPGDYDLTVANVEDLSNNPIQ